MRSFRPLLSCPVTGAWESRHGLKGFTSACDLYTKFSLREVNASGLFCACAGAGLADKKQGLSSERPSPSTLRGAAELSSPDIPKTFDFAGQVALVTGSGRGLGRMI